jgi:hypothetical protein
LLSLRFEIPKSQRLLFATPKSEALVAKLAGLQTDRINAALEGTLPQARRVSALTMLSRAYFTKGDFEHAAAALESAEIAAAEQSPETVVLALCRYADVVLMTAGPAAALPIVARARTFAERGSKDLQAQVRAAWGLLAFWSGDPSGLVAAESEGRHLLGATPSEVAADLRLNVSGLTILLPFAGVEMFAGRFVEAETVFRAGIDAAERAGALSAATALGIFPQTFLYSYLGRQAPEYVALFLVTSGLVVLGVVMVAVIRYRRERRKPERNLR